MIVWIEPHILIRHEHRAPSRIRDAPRPEKTLDACYTTPMRLSLRLQEALLAFLGYGLLFWHPDWFPVSTLLILRGLLVMVFAWVMGERLFPNTSPLFERFFGGVIAWASLLSLASTAAYYFSLPLHASTFLLLDALIAGAALLVPDLQTTPVDETSLPQKPSREWIALALCVLVNAGSFFLLVRTALLHQATTSIRTPWPLLPNGTFLLFALLFAASLVAASGVRTAASTWLATISWLSISALPTLLYPLGYGFDGFIHRASQELLLSSGVLTPKPLYYMGQYVWTVWLSHITAFPLAVIDAWLVPVTVFLVGFALYGLLRRSRPEWRFAPSILLLCLPLAAFVTTTPQSWSYLLGFAALIFALWPDLERRMWAVPLLLSAWAVVTHPLGGLPFACLVGTLWLTSFVRSRTGKILFQSLGLLGALLVIPCAFWAQSHLGNTPITWSWDWIRTIRAQDLFPTLFFSPRQTLTLWLDGAEWARVGTSLGTVLLGGWLFLRPSAPHDRLLTGTGIGLLLIQFLLEKAATFDFLISYERGNYTDRLGVLSALCLAIPAARWLSSRFEGLRARSGFLWMSFLLLFTGLWTLRVYDALPRHDAAQASSGWSVGRADVDAVRWIHDQAGARPYTVLANQAVSAAALQKYGFARYHEDIFYYPLPTGGPLYQVFLEAASTQATSSTIKRAASLSQSELVYVVINNYWWDAERVREHLGAMATRALSFSEGRVWVYEFPLSVSTTTASIPISPR